MVRGGVGDGAVTEERERDGKKKDF